MCEDEGCAIGTGKDRAVTGPGGAQWGEDTMRPSKGVANSKGSRAPLVAGGVYPEEKEGG